MGTGPFNVGDFVVSRTHGGGYVTTVVVAVAEEATEAWAWLPWWGRGGDRAVMGVKSGWAMRRLVLADVDFRSYLGPLDGDHPRGAWEVRDPSGTRFQEG